MKVLQAVISNKKGQKKKKKKIRARSHGASVVLTPACLWSPSRGGGGDVGVPARWGPGDGYLLAFHLLLPPDYWYFIHSVFTDYHQLASPSQPAPNDHHCQTDKGGASFSRGLPKTTGLRGQLRLSSLTLVSTACLLLLKSKRKGFWSSAVRRPRRTIESSGPVLWAYARAVRLCVLFTLLYGSVHINYPSLLRARGWAAGPVHSTSQYIPFLLWTYIGRGLDFVICKKNPEQ